MDAHKEMTDKDIRFEDVKAAADANGNSVAKTIDIMERTIAKDRDAHKQEYAAD
jgi:hypothetical protein